MAPPAKGNEGGTGVGEGGDAVELRSLDSFGLPRIAFIKIDVEGYEDHVLDGAKALIARAAPEDRRRDPGRPRVRGRDRRSTARTIDATKAKLEELGYNVRFIGASDYLATPKNEPTSDTCH